MNANRRSKLWAWVSGLPARLVCLVSGHQDFGVAWGLECQRCGRKSVLDVSNLPLPRLKYSGDPDRHRIAKADTGVLRASGLFDRPAGVPENVQCAFVPEVPGDTYARKPMELTERGRRRLADIGWLKPGDTLTVELLSEADVRRIVKTETERARAAGLLSAQEQADARRRRRAAALLDVIKPVKGVH